MHKNSMTTTYANLRIISKPKWFLFNNRSVPWVACVREFVGSVEFCSIAYKRLLPPITGADFYEFTLGGAYIQVLNVGI